MASIFDNLTRVAQGKTWQDGGGAKKLTPAEKQAAAQKLAASKVNQYGQTPGQAKLFNPDGTLVSPARPSKNKTYRGIYNTALGLQDFIGPISSAITKSQIANAPALAQSQLDVFNKFNPQFAQSQANTDLGLLTGTGKDITQQTLNLQKLADPEFFNIRDAIGKSATALIAGQDPNKLTGSEIANTERATNRSNIGRGLEGSGSNTAAVSSALTFDNKLQQKRNNLLNTLTNIGNFSPNLKSGAFNYAAATGQGAQANATNAFNQSSGQTSQLGGQLLGQAGQIQQQRVDVQANKIPGWQRVVSSLPDY